VRLRQVISLVAITLFVTLLGGCADSVPAGEGGNVASYDNNTGPSQSVPPHDEAGSLAGSGASVSIIVTRDFGKPAILEKTVVITEDTTALDALQAAASVETKYGGGFVGSIEGISSKYEGDKKTKEDWFFYVNGISVSTGAGGYILQDGDSEHWDYHDWSFRQFIPAIVGDFPEPFLHGFKGEVYPTVVAYQHGWEEAAHKIADSLWGLGVRDVAYQGFDELSASDKEASNLVLVGTSDFEPVGELNQPWNRLGFFGHFQDGSLTFFGSTGELAGEYGEGAGLIQATQSIWNPKGVGAGENVVWMVSGLDESGVKAAVDIIVNHPDTLKYACAVVVSQGETLKVPQ
jgi:hypothetical protein